MTPRILILCALASEAKAIWAAVGSQNVWVRAIGPGAVWIENAKLTSKPEVIIVAGVGGALDPTLLPGVVVIDNCPEGFAIPGSRPGRIHTAPSIVSTPGEKAALFHETGALAVDMEQGRIAAAAPPGSRIIGVRSILDTANQILPRFVDTLVDERGQTRVLAVLTTLITRPWTIGPLISLGMQNRRSLKTMAQAVGALVRFLSQQPPPRRP